MSNAPDISVVMSVYNNADTLPAALDSILSQEGVELEFIVIDDGSTDGSGKILDEAASHDLRLKVIHKENEGLTKALAEGCALASAPWIARQDADDVSLSGRLKRQLIFLKSHPEVVLCTCGTRVLAPEGETVDEIILEGSVEEQTKRLREDLVGVPSHGCCMFRRDAYEKVGGYHWQFYYAQDADLWLRMIEVGQLGGTAVCLYELREGVSGISVCNRKFQKQFCHLAHAAYEARRNGELEKQFLDRAANLRENVLRTRKKSGRQKIFADGYSSLAARLRCRGDRIAARKYLWYATRAAPFSVRIWKEWARLLIPSSMFRSANRKRD